MPPHFHSCAPFADNGKSTWLEEEFSTHQRGARMMKKGKWSKEEDYLIRNNIEKHGIGRSWQELSNTLGLF
jgi:hypothetical protein